MSSTIFKSTACGTGVEESGFGSFRQSNGVVNPLSTPKTEDLISGGKPLNPMS